MYEKSCSIFKLTYEIKGESIIKLFDEGFAQDPKISCKMIIDNKYQIFDYNQKFLKVKLLIMNKKKINLSYMFYECYSLISFPNISKWNTNNIKKMESMFRGCVSLISLPDISKLNI